jgi:SAM-dependent methyltransferase
MIERIGNAGNTTVPAILAMESKGYRVTWRPSISAGNEKQWFAEGSLGLFFAEDPVTVLGLIAIREIRGPNWRASDSQISDFAIRRAKQKAAERGQAVTFLVKDAMTLKDWSERFDNVTDSGLFHCFSDENRKTYVEGLATVLKPGGRVFLMCFSDAEPGTDGPRRISERELRVAFADGWEIESLEPSQFETRPNLKDFTFSPGGPKTWFAIIRRK